MVLSFKKAFDFSAGLGWPYLGVVRMDCFDVLRGVEVIMYYLRFRNDEVAVIFANLGLMTELAFHLCNRNLSITIVRIFTVINTVIQLYRH
jgi:hypothetical protein